MPLNLEKSEFPRIIIVGAGFGGLRLARKLINKPYQVVLIDRNNFHQFQPLFYQVATSGLAPSSISFPIRKLFHGASNVHFRMAEIQRLDTTQNILHTSIGQLDYDSLVIATGADTNYFSNKEIQRNAFPMKSVQESLTLRNRILQCMEEALVTEDSELQERLMNVVVVGGGPTGTEVSGAISEMKRFVLPKDYPEIDFDKMEIHLLEASPQLLNGMSDNASSQAKRFLSDMGVNVHCNAFVESYDGKQVRLKGGKTFTTSTLIWAAGVKGNVIDGLDPELIVANGRVKTDPYHKVAGSKNLFAIGDVAYTPEEEYQNGHPQVAQVAIQQADNLAKNLIGASKGKQQKAFHYKDLGSMATIGRNRAVVDLPYWKFTGFFAWVFWLFVHLMSILGVKNKFFIFVEWLWNYITFDQSLRLVIKQKPLDESKGY